MKSAVVIPSHNRKDCLANLLAMLERQTAKESLGEIVVVLDGSTDGSYEMIRKDFPRVAIVSGDGSWLFTKSANKGFRRALQGNPEYVLVLNDDVEIGDDYVATLLRAAKETKAGSVVGSISYTREKPSRILFSGVVGVSPLTRRSIRYHNLFEPMEPPALSGIKKTLTLPGRGMLIPSLTLNAVGLFDEGFPQYHSDADFCLRAKAAGYGVFISWDAVVYSHVEKTASVSSFLKAPLGKFLKSFIDPNGRYCLSQISRYILRHKKMEFYPFYMTVFILATVKAYLFRKKIEC